MMMMFVVAVVVVLVVGLDGMKMATTGWPGRPRPRPFR